MTLLSVTSIVSNCWNMAGSSSGSRFSPLPISRLEQSLSTAFSLRRVALVIVFIVATNSIALADGLPCSVDGNASGSDISATVSSNGVVPLFLFCTRSATSPKEITLSITEFWSDAGSVHVNLLLPPDFKPSSGNGPFSVPFDAVIPVRLSVGKLPTEGKYSGRLVITAEGKDAVIAKLILTPTSVPTGALVLDRQSVVLQVSRSLFWWSVRQAPSFSLTLREKSGLIGMQGITVRLEQVSKQPGRGFSLGQNIAFTINHQSVADLEVWPPKQPEPERSFGPGGQAVVGMSLKNLVAGEYDASLRFQAVNSVNNDAQKLSLVVQVRDSIWWAVIMLIVAVGFSFFATKVVTSLSRRFKALGRIRELRPAWLSQEQPLLAVVWVRAILKQSEDLSRRYWLTSADSIDANINKVSSMVALLDRVRRLREELARSANLPRLPYVRATAALNRIVSQLGNLTLTEAEQTQISTALTDFVKWFQPSTLNDTYWASVSGAINSLCSQIALGEVRDPEAQSAMSALEGAIKASQQQKPQDLDGMMEIERQYAALKVLWQWHASEKFPDFIDLIRPPQPTGTPLTSSVAPQPIVRPIDDAILKQLFELADRSVWELLKTCEAANTIKIKVPPPSEPESIEAYDPIKLWISSGNGTIDESYLFQRALEFRWTFQLDYAKRWARRIGSSKIISFSATSSEPRIAQYAPRAGKFTAQVRILNSNGDRVEIPESNMDPTGLEIARSSDFGIFRGLAEVEITSWLLAAVIAIVTGLSMFYFKGPTFGSFQDYVSLFLWGAGVDQGKNFLQAIQAYSVPPAKSP